MEDKVKSCATCGHIRGRRDDLFNWKQWQCFKSEPQLNLVTGQKDYMLCSYLRQAPIDLGLCGAEGNWYEEYIPPVREQTIAGMQAQELEVFDEDALSKQRALAEAKVKEIKERKRKLTSGDLDHL